MFAAKITYTSDSIHYRLKIYIIMYMCMFVHMYFMGIQLDHVNNMMLCSHQISGTDLTGSDNNAILVERR